MIWSIADILNCPCEVGIGAVPGSGNKRPAAVATGQRSKAVKHVCAFGELGAAGAGFYLPNVYVQNIIGKRKTSISRAFPDALDLMLICVEAGMTIETAFNRVAREIGGQSVELAEELALTTAELTYLSDRRIALENFGMRTDLEGVKSVVTALIQSERYGTPLGSALRVMASEIRDQRMSAAEKKAGALPAQLTVPMIAFFLPVLFVVILGPAIISLNMD